MHSKDQPGTDSPRRGIRTVLVKPKFDLAPYPPPICNNCDGNKFRDMAFVLRKQCRRKRPKDAFDDRPFRTDTSSYVWAGIRMHPAKNINFR